MELPWKKINLIKVDPKTISSVNVLKGDAATRIYGEKGKNGEVVITLKVNKKYLRDFFCNFEDYFNGIL